MRKSALEQKVDLLASCRVDRREAEHTLAHFERGSTILSTGSGGHKKDITGDVMARYRAEIGKLTHAIDRLEREIADETGG